MKALVSSTSLRGSDCPTGECSKMPATASSAPPVGDKRNAHTEARTDAKTTESMLTIRNAEPEPTQTGAHWMKRTWAHSLDEMHADAHSRTKHAHIHMYARTHVHAFVQTIGKASRTRNARMQRALVHTHTHTNEIAALE